MVQKQWSKSDIKKFISEVSFAQTFMSKKSSVFQNNNILVVDNIPSFFNIDDVWVPTLHLLLKYTSLLPKVVVDKGAIKFVVNGADIMRPGITSSDSFQKGDFIVIVDENYSKPLAVGKSLLSSEDLLASSSGKVISNLHFIGDDIWKVN